MSQPLEVVPGGAPRLNRDHVMNLQGRDYATYPGTLDLAHQKQIKRLVTAILQVPGPENNGTAIVQATVEFEDGSVFSDVGEAGPHNLKPAMVKFALAMASTRAKGRAMRDACNIGEALDEEFEDTPARAQTRPERPAKYQGSRHTPPPREVVETRQGPVVRKTGEMLPPAVEDERVVVVRRWRALAAEAVALNRTTPESLGLEEGQPLSQILARCERKGIAVAEAVQPDMDPARLDKARVALQEFEFAIEHAKGAALEQAPAEFVDVFADE